MELSGSQWSCALDRCGTAHTDELLMNFDGNVMQTTG